MFVKVTKSRDRTTLLGLAHVLAFVEWGGETQVRLLPGCLGHGEATMRIDEPMAIFEGLPGFMATRLVSPHADPRPALVNMALVVMAEGCEEGSLLHHCGGTGHKLLIESTAVQVLAFADAFVAMRAMA